MVLCKIYDDLKLLKEDFNNDGLDKTETEYWLLNPMPVNPYYVKTIEECYDNCINREKFPLVMTELYKRHPVKYEKKVIQLKDENTGHYITDDKGNILTTEVESAEDTFDYMLITKNKEQYGMVVYICNENKIIET